MIFKYVYGNGFQLVVFWPDRLRRTRKSRTNSVPVPRPFKIR